MDFAQRVKELRKKKGLTQTDLAKALKVTKGTVSTWETGSRKPEFGTMDRLCDFFDVSLSYLIGSSDDASPAHMTEEEIIDLGKSEVSEIFAEYAKKFCRLDAWGQNAVKSIITAEYERCAETKTLQSDKVDIAIRFHD
ncbi:helix-turn-helix domain-containing protein [uncultured Acidaminococcus sp.]|uniref:helix-turn-helix domain-containing protein n=1 Tax=uncultured Acidaminococcus sp. TaxID=352152 RepID=UPI0025980123|nr:helix-turn-helix transcriptional regulator [uncultured Acidaminococcus sp.]